jgi:hypothetical protein
VGCQENEIESEVRICPPGTANQSFDQGVRRATKSSLGPSTTGMPELLDSSCSLGSRYDSEIPVWDLPADKQNTGKHADNSALLSSIRWPKPNLAPIYRKVMSNIQRTSNHETAEFSFWTSQPAKHVYTVILLGILARRPIMFYGVLAILLRKISVLCSSWCGYCAHDKEARIALGSLRTFLRLLVKESEKAAAGEYGRLVGAGYALYFLHGTG